jgi:hypothetical protein
MMKYTERVNAGAGGDIKRAINAGAWDGIYRASKRVNAWRRMALAVTKDRDCKKIAGNPAGEREAEESARNHGTAMGQWEAWGLGGVGSQIELPCAGFRDCQRELVFALVRGSKKS